MDEHILAAAIDSDKAESLLGVVPFHHTLILHLRTAFPGLRSRRPCRSGCLSRGQVDFQHFRDLWPLLALAEPDLELGAGWNRLVPRGLERADVQEGFPP